MKYLVYLITLLFGTAVAQNPTILQGNYVSNVFGQANFVLNPNAQTSTTNVTVSNATVTRPSPIVTPLVATTEFNVEVTSANGTITWATRSFDAGMKNQNCEARFTYRGFQATSKAQIKQGANVIAELTLTSSATDPRIASINFPCGDLSAATTFVITDTATLSGTNEIGGIYVGLATNQANVAQAEFYGSLIHYGTSGCQWVGNSASPIVADNDCTTYTKTGYDIQPSTNVPAINFTPVKSGNYQISVSAYIAEGGTSANVAKCSLYENNVQISALGGSYTSTANNAELRQSITLNSSLSSGTSYTYDIRCVADDKIIARSIEESLNWTIYRFPSSSELVVTPETQNVWGGSRYYGSVATATIGIGSADPTGFLPLNSSSMTARRTLTGRCNAPTSSADDVGCSIENMPVGSYKIEGTGLYNVVAATTTNTTICNFEIYETTSATSVSVGSYKRNGQQYGIVYQPSSQSGIFQNSAVATRNFVIRANKTFDDHTSNNGGCQVYIANSGADISSFNITVTPIDNASNSALYVQGPVKAAETGTAIPAGYVGEEKIASVSNTSFSASGVATNVASLVLPAGVWYVYAQIYFQAGGGTTITAAAGGISTSSATLQADSFINIPLSTTQDYSLPINPRVISTPGTTIYLVGRTTYSSGTPQSNGTFTKLKAVRLN